MLDWQEALLDVRPGESLGGQTGLVVRCLAGLEAKGLARAEMTDVTVGGIAFRHAIVHLTPAGETLAASLRGHECTDECDEMADTERAVE